MVMKVFGLVGRGIGHSFSAGFFNDKFRREGREAEYRPFDLNDISQLKGILDHTPGLCGLNVTSPYKREVIPFLDSLSPEAQALQAVNTIEVISNPDGTRTFRGHNTDCPGFGMTLEGLVAPGTEALVLGTGGASSAVQLALTKRGISYHVVSRSPRQNEISYKEADELIPSAILIINATPVGMHPHVEEYPDIDYDKISADHICYDLIYNPSETLFLKKASRNGAKTVNGLQMLHNQANLSWEIWQRNL